MPSPELLAPYGAIGVLLALIGWIVRVVVAREIARADAAEQREKAMRDKLDERILPLLGDVARLLAEKDR